MSKNSLPAARPILGYSRTDGQPVALIASSSVPGLFHITTADSCSCKSFSYRRHCRHLGEPVYDGVKVPLLARLMA